MSKNKFLAGVGRALIISNGQLIAVAKTLQNSGFNFDVTAEEIRGGATNPLLGRYFHDSSLSITLTDALFDLEYIALNIGADIQSGGITLYEGSYVTQALYPNGSTDLSYEAVPFDGAYLGWWKLPEDTEWKQATILSAGEPIGMKRFIPTGYTGGAGKTICYKYFYNDANARSVVINADYNPKVVSLIVINDEFSGDVSDVGNSSKCGRLVTSIPNFQFNGTNDLAFAAGSATSVTISGTANAVLDGDTCVDEPYYGTITEEIFNENWQDRVIALAIANADITAPAEINANIATAQVYAVFGGMTASKLIDNYNCIFAVEADGGTGVTVGNTVSTAGVIGTTTADTGTAYISVTLKDASGSASTTVAPATMIVTIASAS